MRNRWPMFSKWSIQRGPRRGKLGCNPLQQSTHPYYGLWHIYLIVLFNCTSFRKLKLKPAQYDYYAWEITATCVKIKGINKCSSGPTCRFQPLQWLVKNKCHQVQSLEQGFQSTKRSTRLIININKSVSVKCHKA